jgi:hypothetical protein
MKYQEEMKGFKAHAIITFLVLTLLTAINLIVVPEFLWVLFPLTGMSIGLGLHYYFGIRPIKTKL